MDFKIFKWLVLLKLLGFTFGWLNDRPLLNSNHGNLIISSARDRNITFKTIGSGSVTVNDINLLNVAIKAHEAVHFVEKWKNGMQQDVLQVLDRLEQNIVNLNNRIESLLPTNISFDQDPWMKDLSPAVGEVNSVVNTVRYLKVRVAEIERKLKIDDCLSDPCKHDGTCIDIYDGFQCHCPLEWEGPTCEVDVNECEVLPTDLGCQNGGTCINLPGSFSCECPHNWHGTYCGSQTTICNQTNHQELCGFGVCVAATTPLGYSCICDKGWNHKSTNDPACRKRIDACHSASRYPCSVDPLVECHNVPGEGIRCGPCPAGYSGDGHICFDIDECLINNGGCSNAVECINTRGSRRCGLCPDGYRGDGTDCSYEGSCLTNNGGCHPMALCTEGPNSQVYCRCPPGYNGPGVGPTGCKLSGAGCASNPCHNNGMCIPWGSIFYKCQCLPGYTGENCNEIIDLCQPNPCKNNGTCKVVDAQAYCICTSRFQGSNCQTPRESCGGYITQIAGNLSYPMNPEDDYPPNLSCAWVIATPEEGKVLNITFLRFSLESSEECRKDYIQIHDGKEATDNKLGTFCGPMSTLTNHGNFISSDKFVYIWLKTNALINDKGFLLTWNSITPDCGGWSDQGYVESPGYPGNYPKNRDCYWNVIVPYGFRIGFQMTKLQLQNSLNCDHDYIEINETLPNGEKRTLQKFCNSSDIIKKIPTTLSTIARVHFHSDSSGSAQGFLLTYHKESNTVCGATYTDVTGIIKSPGYDSGHYERHVFCEWAIIMPEIIDIKLEWLDFEVEYEEDCEFDAVKIYNGNDPSSSPLLGRFCGDETPYLTLIHHPKEVLITFQSDHNQQYKGFVLKYSISCDEHLTALNGTITSPFYPKLYPSDAYCTYKIELNPGYGINLHLESMDIESPTFTNSRIPCKFDYLAIYDGDSDKSPLLQKLCGRDELVSSRDITSSRNMVFLKFVTDESNRGKGFNITYNAYERNCGGIYNRAPGTIRIPGDIKGSSIDCLWTLRANENQIIQLNWIIRPLPETASNRCPFFNFIEIIDNRATNSTIRPERYCKNHPMPQEMMIQSNDVTIHGVFRRLRVLDQFEFTYTFLNEEDTCGGEFHTQMGLIHSPNVSGNYRRNQECIWKIEVPERKKVVLHVHEFELESIVSEDCERIDYLEIRSGLSQSSPLINRYCGTNIPTTIPSSTHQMYVKFHSDFKIVARGFNITWDTTTDGCGGSLHESAGQIDSPNYPQPYYHRASCTWDIVIAQGNRIRMTIVDFQLGNERLCSDYLEISDVFSGYEVNRKKYCGTQNGVVVLSNTNRLRVHFQSDFHSSSVGFRLKYTTECNVNLNGSHGVIESPNYPRSFGPNLNCEWSINAPRGNGINITFLDFEIRPRWNTECRNSYLLIQESDNFTQKSEGTKYCGERKNIMPFKKPFQKSQVLITLKTGWQFSIAGYFRLEWVVNGCVHKFTKPTGIFSSPYKSLGDLNVPILECEWLIEVDADKSVELTIPEIQLSLSRNCNADTDDNQLEIYDGDSVGAPKISDEHICFRATPIVLTSSSNKLLIKNRIDKNSAGRGFQARYSSVPLRCGGQFRSDSGYIHSENYPQNYPDKVYCEWLITVYENHAVNLTFLDFDLEASRSCRDDYVKVYDGNSTLATEMETLCGSMKNLRSYTSTGNQILIVMKSDSNTAAKGFRASYESTCGGLIFVDNPGILLTREFYGTRNCTWVLTAKDSGERVELLFNYISLAKFGHVSIKVYEGEKNKGLLIREITDDHIPQPIISTGDTLTISIENHRHGSFFDATYRPLQSACGGDIDSEAGSVASPLYPQSYPKNAECIWLIKNSPGNTISLSFTNFELAQSEYCHFDYLEVREDDAIGKLLGHYCGRKEIDDIKSNKSIWIKFESSNFTSETPQGFLMEFKYLTSNEITGTEGEITSPLFTKGYFRVKKFTWRITVTLGMLIEIQFLSFHFDRMYEVAEDESQCIDNLEIFDGYNEDAPKLFSACGLQTINDPVISSNNIVYIIMDSRENSVGNSFHLKWLEVSREFHENEKNDTESIVIDNTSTHRIIMSPDYPDGYKPNIKKSWIFTSPVGTHLAVYFTTMDLETVDNYCYYDYVAVYEGVVLDYDSERENLTKVCDPRALKQMVKSKSNVMTIQFVTDYSNNKTGFSAIVTAECGGIIKEPYGEIVLNSTLNGMLLFSYVCEWRIEVHSGRRIGVILADYWALSLNPQISCETNNLILRDGPTPESQFLGAGKFCINNETSPMNTTNNYLYIKLSISYIHRIRFKLIFNELGQDCGGRFLLDEPMIITTPNYPNIPPPYTECTWTFSIMNGSEIDIHFLERFDLDQSDNCEKEFVEIRDGGTDLSPLLGRFCEHPSTITTTQNMLYVFYHTELADPKNGFKAKIKARGCGRIFRSESGIISSPNYPEMYPTGIECDWWIVGQRHHSIKLEFMDINLPWQVNCNHSDYVMIAPATTINNAQIPLNESAEFYCRTHEAPSVVDLVAESVLVKFVSKIRLIPEFRNRYKGFLLNFTTSRLSCGGELTDMAGTFSSAGYPHTIRDLYCKWNIEIPFGLRVEVEIIDYDNGPADLFSFEPQFYSVSYGAQIRTPRITKGTVVSSTSNFMSVRYRAASGYRGLKARYRARYPPVCSESFDDWSGTFSSPQTAPFNESNYYCEWIINPPISLKKAIENEDDTNLSLSIEVFGVVTQSISRYCIPHATLTINVGYDMNYACGNFTEQPKRLILPRETYTIQAFNGSKFYTPMNFTIKFEWFRCGGIIILHFGDRVTLEPPKNVSYPIQCVWSIRMAEDTGKLWANFTQLNFNDCNSGYLLFKPNSGWMPAKYCDSRWSQDLRHAHQNDFDIEYFATSDSANFQLVVSLEGTMCAERFVVWAKIPKEIQSPGYPNSYVNNLHCLWSFSISRVGYILNVTFIDRFAIEQSPNCTNDYVSMRSPISDTYEPPVKLCGRELVKKSYIFSTPVLIFQFVTNENITADGFKIRVSASCGGFYQAKYQRRFLYSPGYTTPWNGIRRMRRAATTPMSVQPRRPLGRGYLGNLTCKYTIEAADSSENILLTFLDFHVEKGPNCEFDNLTITTVSSGDYTTEETYCGSMENIPKKITSKGKVELVFKSDETTGGRGFRIEYSLNDCGGKIKHPRIVEPTITKDPQGFGYFECTWTIEAPENKAIVLKFDKVIIIDTYGDASNKNYYVKVYEGTSTYDVNQLVTVLSGNLTGQEHSVSCRTGICTVELRVDSDSGDDQALKFGVSFVNSIEAGCGGEIQLNDTMHFSTQRSELYDNEQDCQWLVYVDPGYRVSFSMESIDVRSTNISTNAEINVKKCYGDYLEVRDSSRVGTLLGTVCSGSQPGYFSSFSDILFIRFVSDSMNVGKGIQGTLTKIESPCGVQRLVVVNNETKILTSPGYPNHINQDLTCHWTIFSDDRVHLKFDELHLENSKNCEREYLEIYYWTDYIGSGYGYNLDVNEERRERKRRYELKDMYSPTTHHRYCDKLPHDIYSDDSHLDIEYKIVSDNHVPNKGFKLEYSRPSCSRDYTEGQGRIRRNAENECWITITAPENFTISLYFIESRIISYDPECDRGLEIFDGTFNTTVARKLCADMRPDPFFSSSNLVSLHAPGEGGTNWHYVSGFYDITYTTTDAGRGCGGSFYNTYGKLTSPLYPLEYRKDTLCIWDIAVPRNERVRLTFEEFNIGSKALCSTDHMRIYRIDDETGQRDLLTSFCPEDVPGEQTFETYHLAIEYKTTVNNGGTGWIIYFKGV